MLLDVDLSGYNHSAMVLPWAQLRRFKILTPVECLKVLKRPPSLKVCHLANVESVFSPETSTQIFSSPVPLNGFLPGFGTP